MIRTRRILHILLILMAFEGFNVLCFSQSEPIVAKVKVKGNLQILDQTILDQLTIKPSSKLGRKYFNKEAFVYSSEVYAEEAAKIVSYYQREGFLYLKLDPPTLKLSSKGDKIKITFNVKENKFISIDSVRFVTNTDGSLSDLLKKTEEKYLRHSLVSLKNTRFRDENLQTDKVLITDVFKQAGYAYAIAEPILAVDTIANTAKIEWQISTGPPCVFGSLLITGNNKVASKIIEKQVIFDPSSPYSQKKVADTQRQIYNLGMFRVASVRTVLSSNQNDTIPVRIVLQEAPRLTSKYGVGYGKEEKFRATADFQFLGFMGGTRRLNLLLHHSSLEPYKVELKLTQPAFLSPKGTGVINPFVKKEVEPAYELQSYGVNTTYLHEISKYINGSVTFFYEKVNQDTLQTGMVNNSYEDGIYDKSGISFGFVYDSSLPIFDPIKGFSIAANTKTNGIFQSSSYPFNRVLLEFKYFKSPSAFLTMACKLKLGSILQFNDTVPVPAEERFYAGGSSSVRGWARSQLGPKDAEGVPIGGNSLFEGSVEARFRFKSHFIFPLFLDFGNVWPESMHYSLPEIRYSLGAGLRIKTPIGPAGIDVARPIFDSEKSWQLHFNIGHPF